MSEGREYDSTQNQPPPWKVLSLDGGGVRGLTELLILEKIFRVMTQILTDRGAQPESELRPCDYFDLIGGTSNGGVIALMLGRLKLNLSVTIAAFQDISKNTFQLNRRKVRLLGKSSSNILYDEEAFTTELKRLVKMYYGDEDLPLKETSEPKCRVFVCSTKQHTSSTQLLRSYASIDDSYSSCAPLKIWEAARATSAAPLLFKPMTIERPGQPRIVYDGCLTESNPIVQVMSECYRLDPNRKVGCVISLGTGVKVNPGLKANNLLLKLVIIMAKEAMTCEKTHRYFRESSEGGRLEGEQRYFRFSANQNLDGVKLDRWESWGAIQDYVNDYVTENRVQIRRCAELLLNSQVETTQQPNLNEIPPRWTDQHAEGLQRDDSGDFDPFDKTSRFTLDTDSLLDDSTSVNQDSVPTLDQDPEQLIADEINRAEAFLEEGRFAQAYVRFQLATALILQSPGMPSSLKCQAYLGLARCRISASDDAPTEDALEGLRSAYEHALIASKNTDDASRPAAQMALLVLAMMKSEMESGHEMSPLQVSTFYGELNGQVEVLEYLIDGEQRQSQQNNYKELLKRGLEWR